MTAISVQSRPLSIAAIRARYAAPPVVAAAPPPSEAAHWIATVNRAGSAAGSLDITRTMRPGGGYEIHVGRRRVVVVEAPGQDGRQVVVNLCAAMRSPALGRAQADTMALRIAHLQAMA